MEPDGDTERLFIAPTGEDSQGQRGEKKCKKEAARGGEKKQQEQHVAAGGIDAGGVLLWSGIDPLVFKDAHFEIRGRSH